MPSHVFFHVALHDTMHPVALAHVAHELDRHGLRRHRRHRRRQVEEDGRTKQG